LYPPVSSDKRQKWKAGPEKKGGYTRQHTRSSHILNLSDSSAPGRKKLDVL